MRRATSTMLALLLVATCTKPPPRTDLAAPGQAAPSAAESATIPTMSKDAPMARLADAFDRKDLAALDRLISDAYSGLRFSSSWTDLTWHRFAAAFRTATLINATDREQSYELRIEPEQLGGSVEVKRVMLVPNNEGQWQLIYRTFMITPHM